MPQTDDEKFDKITAIFKKEIRAIFRYLVLGIFSVFAAPILGIALALGVFVFAKFCLGVTIPFWIVISFVIGFCFLFAVLGGRFRVWLEERLNRRFKDFQNVRHDRDPEAD